MVQAIPDNYPRLTPYLCVDGAAQAIDFYTRVLGADERMRMPGPDGKIGHCELAFGNSLIMLADEFPEMGVIGPKSIGGTPVTIHLYVEDVDSMFQAAVDGGATEISAPRDEFYGDRISLLEDPFGHRWSLATHIEDVPAEEMAKRASKAMGDLG